MTQNNAASTSIPDVDKERGMKPDDVRQSNGFVTAIVTPIYDKAWTENDIRERLTNVENTFEKGPNPFEPSQTVKRFCCKFPTFDAVWDTCAEIGNVANVYVEASIVLDQIELHELARYHAGRIVYEQESLSIPSTSELVTYNLRVNLNYHTRRFHDLANVLGEQTAQRILDQAGERGART
jgi:hypothetical protein